MRRLVFTNTLGRSVAFDGYGKYIALKIEGLGDIPVENETQKAPGQDGVTWLDATFDTRMVTVEGVINMAGENAIYKARAELSAVLNPKLGPGTLTYYAGKTSVRMLRLAQASLPAYPEKDGNAQLYLARIEGIDPYWYETTYNATELDGWEGGQEFPIEFPIEYEGRSASAEMYLYNTGDEITPIEAWFRGPMTQAQITNESTGEFIRVNKAIAANEEMYISTQKGNKKVLLTNLDIGEVTNAFGYLDRASRFWQLQRGANFVSYDPSGNGVGTKVRVRFRNRFVGV